MPPAGKTVQFNLGYAVGMAWNTNFVPGGPFALKPRHDNSNPDLVARCAVWQREHDDWMAGFRAANARRKLRAA